VTVANLRCDNLEPLLLQAQSVPSASLVPCVRSLPTGWELANLAVNDGRSVITFKNDRGGDAAMVVRLSAACTPAVSTEVPSDRTEVHRYQQIEQLAPVFTATRFDVFAGGCVTTRLTAPAASRALVAGEAPLILGYVTRSELRQALGARSDGRLRLDP
jgi:hypothetical protein